MTSNVCATRCRAIEWLHYRGQSSLLRENSRPSTGGEQTCIYIYIHMYTHTDILIHLYLYLHCMLPYIISMHFHGGVIHCFHRLLWFPAGHHEAADLILKVNGEPVTGDWLVHRIQRSPVYVRNSLRFTEIHIVKAFLLFRFYCWKTHGLFGWVSW